MKTQLQKYVISILRPGGNDTALVEGIVAKEERKIINDIIMRTYPAIEQVGFYTVNVKKKQALLEMAGGEFCGNATRSLVYLLTNGRQGNFSISVSGTSRSLQAGVLSENTAYSYMPIFESFDCVKQIDAKLFLVELEGISHIITPRPKNVCTQRLKKKAKALLEKYNLLYSRLAAGVMFVSEDTTGELRLDPIVWVRDIETLFYESACASGVTAIGLWKAKDVSEKKITVQVLQPSGKYIFVNVEKNEKGFVSALINGPISLLEQTTMLL